jgi:hypothetical protein
MLRLPMAGWKPHEKTILFTRRSIRR